jgi:hypothetical protein
MGHFPIESVSWGLGEKFYLVLGVQAIVDNVRTAGVTSPDIFALDRRRRLIWPQGFVTPVGVVDPIYKILRHGLFNNTVVFLFDF